MATLQDFKEELKSNANIVNVISRYVNLKQKGKTYWGCCPFHLEKTPSFAVNEMGQFYHCFGCGESGDVYKFIEKVENVDFFDALKILADIEGVKVPDFAYDEKTVEKKKDRDNIYNLLKDTANYYYKNLSLPEAEIARKYLAKRKINNSTVKTFGLGYSKDWDSLITYLQSLGYTKKQLLDSGVADEKNGKLYDAYAQRLIFPLQDSNGQVVGFTARLLEDKGFAKYKNTKETDVFNKRKIVYGLHLIKKEKKDNAIDSVIVVEGPVDVISVYQSGIHNVAAFLGTAITPLHAKEIKKVCDKVILCMDGDSAGVKSALRSIDILREAMLDVYVVVIPNKMDPDEYINKYGREAFDKIITSAKYWTEFLIRYYATTYNFNLPQEKAKYLKLVFDIINKLDSTSEKEIYLQIVKELTNISMDILRRDLITNTTQDIKQDDRLDNQQNAYVKATLFVLNALLNRKSYARLNSNIPDCLVNNDYKKVYDYINECKQQDKQPIMSHLFDEFDVDNNVSIKNLVEYTISSSEDNAEYYNDCVKNILISGLTNQQDKLSKLISNESDINKRREMLIQLNEIVKKIKNINGGKIYE